jgi:tetratricopeptide (TPR) repeat protein
MARRKNKKKEEETLVDLVEAKESLQDYFERNQLLVLGIIAAVIIVIGGIFAYMNLYKAPRNQNAMQQMYQAQFQFEQDSFAKALENPGGGYDGFLDIIDNYSGTKAANTAKYYAGVSYLRLGRIEAAISFLKDFSASGDVLPISKNGALGDAYSELEDFDKAISHYKKAIDIRENEFLTPYYMDKLAKLYEHQGKFDEAQKYFKIIKEKYPNSSVGRDVDKFLKRAELRKGSE